jgi:hypothetical protein
MNQCFRQPVNRPFFFGLERAKQAVPDNENATVIFVKVFQVGVVMHRVMRGGIVNSFNGLREFVNRLRVNPELVDQLATSSQNAQAAVRNQMSQQSAVAVASAQNSSFKRTPHSRKRLIGLCFFSWWINR